MDDYSYDCGICGQPIYHGDRAYGVSVGTIAHEAEGFIPSASSPWDEVMCTECWEELDEALLRIREQRRNDT